MRRSNPFRPTFGRPPYTLSGRDDAIRRFRSAMVVGPDHPDYSMLIKGPRGSGKTVLLSVMRGIAERNGMGTVRVTAKPEPTFADALIESMVPRTAPRPRFSSARISILGTGAGLSVENPDTDTDMVSIHTRMLVAMETLADHAGSGVRGTLITIDEFHNSNIAAARDFAHALQDVAKIDGKPVMLAAAGLPTMEDTVLSDPGMTFFQRIARIHLDPLTSAEASEALHEPITAAGGAINGEALRMAVDAASGYPFMIQLVGYHSWERCTHSAGLISPADVRSGIRTASKEMQTQVFAPVFRDLSDIDRLVVVAMSHFDAEEVRLSDLARATGKASNYLGVYTDRLRQAGVIHSPARGRLRFVHTTMRDWLRRQHITHTANSSAPKTASSVKERIIEEHHTTPEATHVAIAERLGTSPHYVGRVRRNITSCH